MQKLIMESAPQNNNNNNNNNNNKPHFKGDDCSYYEVLHNYSDIFMACFYNYECGKIIIKLGLDLKKSCPCLENLSTSNCYFFLHYLQSPVMKVTGVLVQGLNFRMFPHKNVVIMSMVVDWVELVLEFRLPGMVLDVHHVLLVSLYLVNLSVCLNSSDYRYP